MAINPEEYPFQVYKDPATIDSYAALKGFKKDEFDEAVRFAVENAPTVLTVYSPQGGSLTIRSGSIDIRDHD